MMKTITAISLALLIVAAVVLIGCSEQSGEAFGKLSFRRSTTPQRTLQPVESSADTATYGTADNPATLSSPVPDTASAGCPVCDCTNVTPAPPSDGPLNCCCRVRASATGALTHMSYTYETRLRAECGSCMPDNSMCEEGLEAPTGELPSLSSADTGGGIAAPSGTMAISLPLPEECCCGLDVHFATAAGSSTITAYETVDRDDCSAAGGKCSDVRHCAELCCCSTDMGVYDWMDRSTCTNCMALDMDHLCGAYPDDPERSLSELTLVHSPTVGAEYTVTK